METTLLTKFPPRVSPCPLQILRRSESGLKQIAAVGNDGTLTIQEKVSEEESRNRTAQCAELACGPPDPLRAHSR